jgi:diguanylate cyclase (GGDEF)-like protein
MSESSPPPRGAWWNVGGWPLWSVPTRALVPILAVIIAAIALTVVGLVGTPLHRDQLAVAALLTALSVVHTELLVGVERMRWKASKSQLPHTTPHVDLTSVWIFAGVMLLPPALSATVSFTVLTHLWFRSFRPAGNPAYRALLSRSTSMLACFAAGSLLHGPFIDTADGMNNLGEVILVATAIVIFLVVNGGIVGACASLAVPDATIRRMLGTTDENILDFSGLGLGAVFATLLVGESPWMVVFLLAVLLILHRAVTAQQLEEAADTDAETGLLNSPAWHRRARRELRRASRHHQKLGVLLLDIDGFRRVNEAHGHLAGNDVLATVGKALPRGARGHELVGRYSGDEFVVLVPAGDDELYRVAGSLKTRIALARVHVEGSSGPATIEGLTASVGGASFPDDGLTLDELLAAAERALQNAKRLGPDSVDLRPPSEGAPTGLSDYERVRARHRA